MSVTTQVPIEQPVRITLPDQLIVQNRQLVKQQVLDLLHQGVTSIVLDFSQCVYCDSTGLGSLVSVSRNVRDAKGELLLEGLNEDMQTLFEMTKLDVLFTIRRGGRNA